MSVTLNVNGQNLRIRRADPNNLVIERLSTPRKVGSQPQWNVIKYYGKLEDLAHGLINLVVDIPQGDNLVEQLALLGLEIRNLEQTICSQIKSQAAAYSGLSGQSGGSPETLVEEVI